MHSPHVRNAVQLRLWRYARQRAVCFTRQPCRTTSFARTIAKRELGSIFDHRRHDGCGDLSRRAVSSKRAVRLRVLIPVLVNLERECDLQVRPVIVSDVDGDPVPDAVVRPPGSHSLPCPQACRPLPLGRLPYPLRQGQFGPSRTAK
jgi:hypothetical protein